MSLARSLLGLMLMLFAATASAVDPLPFVDEAQAQRFRALTAELRCVMCQNQSLADSDASIAGDLRREIFDLMQAGQSDAEIKQFLTARYGDFVLYRPPMKPSTWLLWLSPLAILVAGAGWLAVVLRRRARLLEQTRAAPAVDATEDW